MNPPRMASISLRSVFRIAPFKNSLEKRFIERSRHPASKRHFEKVLVCPGCNNWLLFRVIDVNTVDPVLKEPDAGQLDIDDCLEKIGDGDEAAMRALMNHLYPLVMKLIAARLPHRASMEDIVQMVFIKIFTNLESYSGNVPLEHWVSRIAINTCLDGIRREKARPEYRFADLSEEHATVIEALHASSDELHPAQRIAARELVDELLSYLNADDRLLVHLVYLEGHTYEEAQKITGWSMPTIKVRLFRARRKLKKHLGRIMPERCYEDTQQPVAAIT